MKIKMEKELIKKIILIIAIIILGIAIIIFLVKHNQKLGITEETLNPKTLPPIIKNITSATK